MYEAVNFKYQEHCATISKDYFPLWFVYSVVAVNVSLVSISRYNTWCLQNRGSWFRAQFDA